MNLHSIVAPCVAAVNPWTTADWLRSTGSTAQGNYARTPTYITVPGVHVQMQALTYKDLMQLNGVNISGEARAMYLNGGIEGVNRPNVRGGDLFNLADGTVWLVVHVLENWVSTAGWTKFAVVQQMP